MPRGRKKVLVKTIEEQIIEVKNRIEESNKEIEDLESKLYTLETKKREQDLATLSQTMERRGITLPQAVEILENVKLEDEQEEAQEGKE